MVVRINTKDGVTILTNVTFVDYDTSGKVVIDYLVDSIKTYRVNNSYVDLLSVVISTDDGKELYKITHKQ